MQRWHFALQSVFNDWDGRGLVTSPDIDGLLSAALVATHLGGRLTGIYTTSHLLLLDGASPSEARESLWLDHDVSHPGVRCIGQHLILHDVSDTLPLRHSPSFNPNLFYRQAYPESFKGVGGRTRDKYPFATVHFLMDYFGIPMPPLSTTARSLIAHADGAWAAAATYGINSRIWTDEMFGGHGVAEDLLEYTADASNFASHQRLVIRLRECGVSTRRAAVSRRIAPPWDSVEGSQSIPFRLGGDSERFMDAVRCVLLIIEEHLGWKIRPPERITGVLTGTVETPYPNSIRPGGFDQYMLDEQIFSHAITNQRTLRYTKGINLDET